MPSNRLKEFRLASTTDAQRGATSVEFAIIAALVLTIIFGILEYGLIFLQEHYVANAAREGARIGSRANNFNSFDNAARRNNCLDLAIDKNLCTDRKWRSEREVIEYLDVMYDQDELTVTIERADLDMANDGGEILKVNVEAPNFVPGLVPGLLKLLRTGSNVKNPENIGFTATMAYENPREYAMESP